MAHLLDSSNEMYGSVEGAAHTISSLSSFETLGLLWGGSLSLQLRCLSVGIRHRLGRRLRYSVTSQFNLSLKYTQCPRREAVSQTVLYMHSSLEQPRSFYDLPVFSTRDVSVAFGVSGRSSGDKSQILFTGH